MPVLNIPEVYALALLYRRFSSMGDVAQALPIGFSRSASLYIAPQYRFSLAWGRLAGWGAWGMCGAEL
jgi:hypothetical protein